MEEMVIQIYAKCLDLQIKVINITENTAFFF